jgi:tetratricopeptide (TPR) repeat protein
VITRSIELAKAGEMETALELLDDSLSEAIREDRSDLIRVLSGHAEVLATASGDVRRVRSYYEQRLPHVPDPAFALYNFARMLSRLGELDQAREYAAKSYELSRSEVTDADQDLVKAILTQWPDLDEARI